MSTIKATTLSTQSNATVSIDTVVNGTAKAWVNFNGTGTLNAMIRQGSIYGTPLTSSVSLNTGYAYSVSDSLEDQQGVFISIFR
jgi:hypothetical protein